MPKKCLSARITASVFQAFLFNKKIGSTCTVNVKNVNIRHAMKLTLPYILAYKSRNFGPFFPNIFSIQLIPGP